MDIEMMVHFVQETYIHMQKIVQRIQEINVGVQKFMMDVQVDIEQNQLHALEMQNVVQDGMDVVGQQEHVVLMVDVLIHVGDALKLIVHHLIQ